MQKQSLSKFVVIIPITEQQIGNIELIIRAIDMQTILPYAVVFVFDRCDANELVGVGVRKYNIHYVRSDIPDSSLKKRPGEIYAGHTRNAGVKFIYSNIPDYDAILFIDGDCIPQPELIESHSYICQYSDIPILSCGKRRESDRGWRDRREDFQRLRTIGIFRKDVLITDVSLLKDGLVVWSCNIALNRRCIELIKRFNELYYGESEVFNSEFNGGWGGEDSFVGVMAYVAKVFIQAVARGGVEHICHPPASRDATEESHRFFHRMVDDFKRRLTSNTVPLSIYSINQ